MENETIIKFYPHIPFSKLLLKGKVLKHHSTEEKRSPDIQTSVYCLGVPTPSSQGCSSCRLGSLTTPTRPATGHQKPGRHAKGPTVTCCRQGTGGPQEGQPGLSDQVPGPEEDSLHPPPPWVSQQSHGAGISISQSRGGKPRGLTFPSSHSAQSTLSPILLHVPVSQGRGATPRVSSATNSRLDPFGYILTKKWHIWAPRRGGTGGQDSTTGKCTSPTGSVSKTSTSRPRRQDHHEREGQPYSKRTTQSAFSLTAAQGCLPTFSY